MKTKFGEWAPERFELVDLKRWKYSTTKAKMQWLEDALEFATAFRRGNSKTTHAKN